MLGWRGMEGYIRNGRNLARFLFWARNSGDSAPDGGNFARFLSRLCNSGDFSSSGALRLDAHAKRRTLRRECQNGEQLDARAKTTNAWAREPKRRTLRRTFQNDEHLARHARNDERLDAHAKTTNT